MNDSINFDTTVPPKGIRIDPLAFAKGVEKLCELCKQPARLQCPKCRVTFYCNGNHQKLDWSGIHNQICLMLIPLRLALAPPSSEQERLHRYEQINYRQKQLADLCRTVSEQHLSEKRFGESIPACLQLLCCSISLYGSSSCQLVPAYLLLGQASIGLSKFDQAEEYLCQARWTVSKSESCSIEIKFKLSRSLGILYNARNNFEFAIKEFSDMVYFAYELFGIDSTQVASGYNYMANLFFKKKEIPTAISLYKQVSDIWHKEFITLFSDKKFSLKNTTNYDDVLMTEAMDNMTHIYEISTTYQEYFPADDVPSILHCLACVSIIVDDISRAKEYNQKAIEATKLIKNQEYLRFLQDFSQKFLFV